jgi:hypothetical protein
MRAPATRRRVLLAAAAIALAATLIVLLSPANGAADALSNISPASPTSTDGWMGRYPISRYQIDEFFPAISVSLIGGVDVSGLMPMVAYAASQLIWLICAFISNLVIVVFGFAFNLDLLTGEGGTGGALAPIATAIQNIYTSTFGQPWLIAAIMLVGIWAMWKALVQRRYAQTTAALATSLTYCVIALTIVARPAQTITPLSKLSDELSRAFLSLTADGTISEGGSAAQADSDQLFRTLILNPWTVLEFGGIDHCIDAEGHSTAVQPLSKNPAQNAKLAEALEAGTEAHAEGKQCIDDRNKYAPHFLAYPFQSADRNAEYEALKTGDTGKLPSSDSARSDGSYPLSAADKPAAQAAGKGGQYERLLIAILIFAGELGVWILLGALALGVILAQILLLLLLAFAPAALIAGVFPCRGHALFVGWISRMLGYLARKAVFSLILAILLAVCQALQSATSDLGWLMSFLLQAAFCWTLLLQRRKLTSGLLESAAGEQDRGGLGRLRSLYYASRLTKLTRARRPGPPAATAPQQPSQARAPQPPPTSSSTTLPQMGPTSQTATLGAPASSASSTTQAPRPGSSTSTASQVSRRPGAQDQEDTP